MQCYSIATVSARFFIILHTSDEKSSVRVSQINADSEGS